MGNERKQNEEKVHFNQSEKGFEVGANPFEHH